MTESVVYLYGWADVDALPRRRPPFYITDQIAVVRCCRASLDQHLESRTDDLDGEELAAWHDRRETLEGMLAAQEQHLCDMRYLALNGRLVASVEFELASVIVYEFSMSTPPTDIVNRETGEAPTGAEWKAIKRRAIEIFRSPYAAPELVAWAVDMYPEGFAETFFIEGRPEWVESKLLSR